MNRLYRVQFVEDICGDRLTVNSATFSTEEKAREHYNYVLEHIKQIEKDYIENNGDDDIELDESCCGNWVTLTTFGGENFYEVMIMSDIIDNKKEDLEWF